MATTTQQARCFHAYTPFPTELLPLLSVEELGVVSTQLVDALSLQKDRLQHVTVSSCVEVFTQTVLLLEPIVFVQGELIKD